MLVRIGEFRNLVTCEMDGLVAALQDVTGRRGKEEEQAWRSSLPLVSRAFADPMFQPLHLYFGEQGHLGLEYRLPASSSWCDIVLLGAHGGEPATAILELKHWETWSDKRGAIEGLVEHHGEPALHPSEQVRGYVEYCRNFHSAVLSERAKVYGCVMFTKDHRFDAYRSAPNDKLEQDFPCFAVTERTTDRRLVDYFASRLSEPDSKFAEKFESGHYEQDRSFVVGIAGILGRSTKKSLVLLDNQRFGFALCRSEIDKAVFGRNSTRSKKVIIVEGPPGSGKSAIAAKVWADLAADTRFERGRFVLTTTSTAQETNWRHLVQTVTGVHGAEGIVLPANKYAPEQLQRLKWWKEKRPGKLKPPAKWCENLVTLKAEHGGFWMPDDHLEVSVVDEAHALINPEVPRAITHSGWPNPFGPQAYHIMRASRVSIFFLDQEQRFRERESTSVEDIKKWALELGADVAAEVSLADGQFRCAGSKEYVDWVESLLGGKESADCALLAAKWLKAPVPARQERKVAQDTARYAVVPLAAAVPSRKATLEFKLCDSPFELESLLRARIEAGATARLIASFARPWVTENVSSPHDLPADQQDFCFRNAKWGTSRAWARPWNVIRGSDYAAFVQARPGTRIADDPLAEVGCTYAVRGFDFDYVGLIWLEDLRWDGTQWIIELGKVHETGISKLRRSATRRSNPDPEARAEILRRVRQAYRILLTRAIKGVFVWCVDGRTAERIAQALQGANQRVSISG